MAYLAVLDCICSGMSHLDGSHVRYGQVAGKGYSLIRHYNNYDKKVGCILVQPTFLIKFVRFMDSSIKETLIGWAHQYNDPKYFQEDPIIFPTQFARKYEAGEASLADVEISALLSAHLAWGRRAMIVRDCGRMFDEMEWKPCDYVMNGEYRDEDVSLHRTIKWSEFAEICRRLRGLYEEMESIESLSDTDIRVKIFGQKEDRRAPNKKISTVKMTVGVSHHVPAPSVGMRVPQKS